MTLLEIVRFCETCRHWERNPNAPYVPNDTGWCTRTKHNGDYPEDDGSLAWCFSGGEDSCLSTHRHFGCVMHEGKE